MHGEDSRRVGNIDPFAIDPGKFKYPVTSPADALKVPRRDIRVRAGESLDIGPDAIADGAFHLVVIRDQEDLGILDLVPHGLEYEGLRTAIAADDLAAHELAHASFLREAPAQDPCGCGNEDSSTGGTFQSTYTSVRRNYHPNLAQMLSESYEQTVAPDDLLARVVRGWCNALWNTRGPLVLGLLALNDIDIEDRATLRVDPYVNVLNANDIRIGEEGRMDFQGASVKVRCRSLSGPSPFTSRLAGVLASRGFGLPAAGTP
jgi:hypothetical protein